MRSSLLPAARSRSERAARRHAPGRRGDQRLAHEDRPRRAAEHDVEHARPVRELVDQPALDETDVLAQLAQVDATETSAEHRDRPRIRMLYRGGEEQQAGLARAVRPEDHPVLAFLDAQVDRPEHDAPHVGVGMGAAHRRRRELDHRHGRRSYPTRATGVLEPGARTAVV